MTIFIFGEAMLEYHSNGGAAGLQYGGDTLNTAIHMARAGLDVAYVTALGTDKVSDALVREMADEGINTQYILRHPDRTTGIYAIHLDAKGERSFVYWRDRSAARDMFGLPQMADVMGHAQQASMLYFSLITLAILPEEGRNMLFKLAATVRENGGKVVYDSNFRYNLWPDLDTARAVSQHAMMTSDIGLPTNVDEQQIWDNSMSQSDIAGRWHDAGCKEVVVKAGEHGCVYSDALSPPRQFDANMVSVVDSSGAGDAFNAGYLIGRYRGDDVETSIAAGQKLAAWVVGMKGAIPRRETGI
ncbi:hypothetical protein LPB140_00285 [Sphingorhabdus lutea]|uniref:Carbohydrate kinase PfkB domain-containing protein n=1 Tax=Sphingorhabdus lutea TaxID=1913578 RepID=A0A1L3J8S4_9SPHN|nr:sugar kinase [Sphingorhabdus lutea]APG61539.1 hypothetical protein LPB140_00285 [Sphingorhabdus lutea]